MLCNWTYVTLDAQKEKLYDSLIKSSHSRSTPGGKKEDDPSEYQADVSYLLYLQYLDFGQNINEKSIEKIQRADGGQLLVCVEGEKFGGKIM